MYRWLVLLLALFAGCKRAERDIPKAPPPDAERPTQKSEEQEKPKDDLSLVWTNRGRAPDAGQVPIEFVHSGSEEWDKLKAYWNEPDTMHRAVRIKVPLGLPDPRSLPTYSKMTRERWELGRRLFFSDKLLGDGKSCASCHIPKENYTDGKQHGDRPLNTPALINVLYNNAQFWDGRATHLEEVVQRNPDDELSPPDGPFRHTWPGVISRLRKSEEYKHHFSAVFGSPPTQYAVGVALATYLRTILSANSALDRALLLAKAPPRLKAEHFKKVLDKAALEKLGRPRDTPGQVADDLMRGYNLFHNYNCAKCHPISLENGLFRDYQYHNIGVDPPDEEDAPHRRGRFNVAPLGEKDHWVMGAWKTPSLRGLSLTSPYFHNGQVSKLREAIRWHLGPGTRKQGLDSRPPFLSPYLANPNGTPRVFQPDKNQLRQDLSDLELFLRAIDGEPVPAPVSVKP